MSYVCRKGSCMRQNWTMQIGLSTPQLAKRIRTRVKIRVLWRMILLALSVSRNSKASGVTDMYSYLGTARTKKRKKEKKRKEKKEKICLHRCHNGGRTDWFGICQTSYTYQWPGAHTNVCRQYRKMPPHWRRNKTRCWHKRGHTLWASSLELIQLDWHWDDGTRKQQTWRSWLRVWRHVSVLLLARIGLVALTRRASRIDRPRAEAFPSHAPFSKWSEISRSKTYFHAEPARILTRNKPNQDVLHVF